MGGRWEERGEGHTEPGSLRERKPKASKRRIPYISVQCKEDRKKRELSRIQLLTWASRENMESGLWEEGTSPEGTQGQNITHVFYPLAQTVSTNRPFPPMPPPPPPGPCPVVNWDEITHQGGTTKVAELWAPARTEQMTEKPGHTGLRKTLVHHRMEMLCRSPETFLVWSLFRTLLLSWNPFPITFGYRLPL